MYGSACEWYEERRDATRIVDGDACKYFAERFSFFRHKAISPIDFSDRNVQFPDRRLRRESGAPPTVFSLGGRQLGEMPRSLFSRRSRSARADAARGGA